MTVGELIKELSQFDNELPVKIEIQSKQAIPTQILWEVTSDGKTYVIIDDYPGK